MRRPIGWLTVVLTAFVFLNFGCSDDRDKVTPPPGGDDFQPSSNTTLSGSHTYDSIRIPANVTVTASGDLRLRSRGAIEIAGAIEGDGHAIELRADSSVSVTGRVRNTGSGDGDTLGITILGQGDMTFDTAEIRSGGDIFVRNDSTLTEADFPDTSEGFHAGQGSVVLAADGANPATSPHGGDLPTWTIRDALFGYDTPARAGRDLPQKGGKGERGKSIELRVRGNLVVTGGVTIAAQDGGRGGKGTDESTSQAVAEGGRGEHGGDVRIFATGAITFAPGVTVRSGSGGNGGDAEATGKPRDGGANAASAKATGASAGRSGIIDIRCNDSITLNGAFHLQVGSGGAGGAANAHGADGRPAGADAAQNGGRAEAIGGAGGDTQEKRLRSANVGGLGNVELTGGEGGNGGGADALAGNGGAANEQFPKGGDGGAASATGGKGGRSRLRNLAGNLFAKGGDGGDATIDGANGGVGWSDCADPCAPREGGPGGKGGDGRVEGGAGGAGAPLGSGGDPIIDVVGNGGNGGDGQPVGVHGDAGARTSINHGGTEVDPGLSFHNGADGNPCPSVSGACCGAEQTCVVLTCLECSNLGGVWKGAGTVCDPNPCPRTSGPCCYDDGSCEMTTEENCHGGVWQGVDYLCDPNPCPMPEGACCFPTAPCAVITAQLCEANAGVYQGDGVACTPDPCPEGDGACCVQEDCSIRTREGCENDGGLYMGSHSDCSPDPCPAFGTCCFPTTACILAFETQCLALEGNFRGGESCEPNPCTQAPGACCFESGECTVVAEQDCHGGVFQGIGTDCDPNPCLVETGACCVESLCTLASRANCEASGGFFVANGVPCEPYPCPAFGACCVDPSNCILEFEPRCNDVAGAFFGGLCDPIPCSGPTGACCFDQGECTVTTSDDCHGGTYEGDGTTCAPNPCEQPTGACCADFGLCTITTQAGCSGQWMGAGTLCSSDPCPGTPSGTYLVVLKPTHDPHGHDPFTQWSTIDEIIFSAAGAHLQSTGQFPYVGSGGQLHSDGTFILNGSGTIAGRSNVDVHFKGSFRAIQSGFAVSGSIQLGNDTAPFQLPNGSVTYSVSGESR